MVNKNIKTIILLLTLSLSANIIAPSLAETDYQRLVRMAEAARKRGAYDIAINYYEQATDVSEFGANDPEINTAITEVLAERLQSFQRTAPNYVRFIKIADEAYSNGEYDTAIINYRRALREVPNDRYAIIRIRQSECIKKTKPATGAQFRTFGCPRFSD